MGWYEQALNWNARRELKKQLRLMVQQLASEPGRGLDLSVNWENPTPQDATLILALEEMVTETSGQLTVERWRGKITLTYRQAALDSLQDATGRQLEKNSFLLKPGQKLTAIDPHDLSKRGS